MLTPPPHVAQGGILPSFEEEFAAEQRRAVRTACLVASPLLLTFVALDIWLVRSAWVALFGLRLGGAVGFLLLATLLQRRRISTREALFALVALVMLPITVGAMFSGGTASPYVHAAMLPLAGAALLVPLRRWEAAAMCSLVLALTYPPLLLAGPPIDVEGLVTGASFLVCMAILTVVGAGIRRGALRNEYEVRHRAASQLGLANLGMLAGGLAHELANPLMVAKAAIDELERGDASPAEASEELALVVHAVNRMHEVLTAMRSHTRLGGKDILRVDLADEIENAVLLLKDRLQRGGIELKRKIQPIHPVMGERTLLGQALLNLLINAADAAEEGPRPRWIAVRLEARDGTAIIEVEDNGPGVPEDIRDRIFTPRFTTKGEAGTGLGLWLSAEIARAHDGSLILQEGSAGGALFRLTIPARAVGDRGHSPPTTTSSLEIR